MSWWITLNGAHGGDVDVAREDRHPTVLVGRERQESMD
jgi:hypothetical protein